MAVIAVEHLVKDYGHRRGCFDVSFHVNDGEIYGFLGPNGAGNRKVEEHSTIHHKKRLFGRRGI